MKKRGFTLIELLAVILILGIIALIAVPKVVNIIDEAKENANLNSIHGLINAAENYYSKNTLSEEIYYDDNGEKEILDEIEYSGNKPNDGSLNIDMTGDIALAVQYDNKCYAKSYGSTEIVSFEDLSLCKVQAKPRNDGANVPALYNGLVPVTIADDGTVTKADISNNDWYDYDTKKWANAVVLKDKKGSTTKDNILAYYVWVPKYEFKDNLEPGIGNEKTIEVNFIKKDATIPSEGYIIPPGFKFGDENLSGIWIAKFEPSYEEGNHGNEILCNAESCEYANDVRILPGKSTITHVKISNGFYLSRNLEKVYDITDNSHMMKSSEWAIAAYLSHSKYGKNSEIDNNIKYLQTGSGVGDAYLTNVGQTTTGNITGIYDMAGGTWEYTMSSYKGDDGKGLVGVSLFTEVPDSRYHDLMYDVINMKGYGIRETRAWYTDDAPIVSEVYPWIVRGGDASSGDRGGIWSLGLCQGGCTYETFRPVIVPAN